MSNQQPTRKLTEEIKERLAIEAVAKEIKQRIACGDRDADKAEQHFKSAGLLLIDAKEKVKHIRGLTWTNFLIQCGGVKRSRANELIAIADGRTSVEEVREGYKDRNAKRPKTAVSHGQSPEIPEQDQEERDVDTEIKARTADAATSELARMPHRPFDPCPRSAAYPASELISARRDRPRAPRAASRYFGLGTSG